MDDPTEISKQAEMWHSILSKEGTLKYDFMTSLKKIAMAKIMSSLWMNKQIQQQIVNLYQHGYKVCCSDFFGIEKDIFAKISQLWLPNSICEELTQLLSIFRNLILNWISYHDKYILSPKQTGYSAVNLIHNITWTVRGKIDYVQTAKNILANIDSPLSDDHKCKLACSYCLEDEIALLSSTLVNKFYLSSIMFNQHPMVYFWAVHMTGDKTLLINPPYWNPYGCQYENLYYGDSNINIHIMQLLVMSEKAINDVPIKFMWNKLSNEEKYQNSVFLFNNVDNPDFIFFLLSNLDYDQQENIIKQCSKAVLCAIVREYWWWGKYFLPTALKVIDNIDPDSFWKVLCEINDRKSMCSQKKMYDCYKSLFKRLWQESSMPLKKFIFDDSRWPSLEQFVSHYLNWKKDMDVIDVIFKDISAQQKRSIAFCVHGIQKCANFIKYVDWKTLDWLINTFLSSEEDISQLKQRIIQEKGKEIASYFLKHNKFHEMECFMKWAFISEEEITNFSKSLNLTVSPSNE